MPGPPPKPANQRRNRAPLQLGEYVRATGHGWQHGATPRPPQGLGPHAREAWRAWMTSWMASFWEPSDIPMLRRLAVLYDRAEAGENVDAEIRQLSDRFGITPQGRQKLRWLPPEDEVDASGSDAAPSADLDERRRTLKVV